MLWIGLVLAIVAIMTAGAGHGTPFPTLFLYPVFFMLPILERSEILTWIMLLGQFPLYGLMIDCAKTKKGKLVVLILLILFHGTLVAVELNDESFWKGLE